MMSFAKWGNALYSGEKSYGIISARKKWLSLGLVLIAVSIAFIGIRGMNPSIEFIGGSQFTLSQLSNTSQEPAEKVLEQHGLTQGTKITQLGSSGLRIQGPEVSVEEIAKLRTDLATAYQVSPNEVDATKIGPSWGAGVTSKAVKSLVIFLTLVGTLMAIYFRSWPMSVAALFALAHDMFITAGFFALIQAEVSPATVIGFLTILAYSLYDTVVVFDRVRELTGDLTKQNEYTFAELVNLAVNQTLVRSINTSVVALLPVGAILFIGALLLGAGTLIDISLALFVGMIAGTLSSVFIAPATLVLIEEKRKRTSQHTATVLAARGEKEITVVAPKAKDIFVEPAKATEEEEFAPDVIPGRHLGQSAQPKGKVKKRKKK
ncbi:protein translocase subunit SecF [Gleimia sp. 6138-11-ORH1]|uniref:protein translocase subunit SecF n=1 Tax=Gleimia sp. 6138-11-ORH1 TaxID=2973937 RepID=UPI0021699AE6|nr:protein translocase subunit SecF [Gleimia sp. 6138-11-ORH1]MCS4484409.1 protein translocase subunit SecF [Gleimia sp. 6138-11-ORH1]